MSQVPTFFLKKKKKKLDIIYLLITTENTYAVLNIVKQSLPNFGKTIRYSALHWGHATLAVLFPLCFSSTQRCRQAWWTHLVDPLHLHGLTHSAVLSSSSVAKHTQQLLKIKRKMFTSRRLDSCTWQGWNYYVKL